MTCIAAWIEGKTIWMAGDSAGVGGGYRMQIRSDPKVFILGSYVMGYTSSFRMGQLLRYSFKVPDCPTDMDLDRFMRTDFINAVRKCLSKGGYREKKDEVESGGFFLVGVKGRLFEVCDDFQVASVPEPFMATGCGESFALGALAAMQKIKMHPKQRLIKSLEIAERYSAGVRRPFIVVKQPK